MASSSDTYLSDVHIGEFSTPSDQGTVKKRFTFTIPSDENTMSHEASLEVDDDGDIVVARKQQYVIVIEHAMSTTLEAVGLQVWRGALLMADYLLSQDGSGILHGSVVLELGAGTGLISILASYIAHHVFCTDTGDVLLGLCQRNIESNIATVDGYRNVTVRKLDWKQPLTGELAGWNQKDLDILSKVSLILASDVVYDNELTDAFFNCLVSLHSIISTPPTIIISLEKRLNFSLEDLEVVSPYYEHFKSCLNLTYPVTTSKGSRELLTFKIESILIDFPQYSNYDRVKELELLKLRANITNTSMNEK